LMLRRKDSDFSAATGSGSHVRMKVASRWTYGHRAKEADRFS
jgi:hypothetical protein